MLYNYRGETIDIAGERNRSFQRNITVDYGFYEGTNYSLIRVNRKRTDGNLQFPFVRYLTSRATPIELAQSEKWPIVINAGVGEGIVIENSILFQDTAATLQAGAMPLTIDTNGMLSFLEADTTGKGQQYIANGVVSAVVGFFPLVVDFGDYEYPTDIPNTFDNPGWVRAQRQIIGQYGNGDYAVITGDGRGFNGSLGFTIEEAQALCKALGLKFAYNLDGGGSTQTVIEQRNVTEIYEGTTGRKRSLHIVFNGTTQFEIPD